MMKEKMENQAESRQNKMAPRASVLFW